MLLVVLLSLLWAWNWPNGTVGRVSSDWWLSLGLTTDRSPPRSWFKSLSALDCDNSIGISKSRSPALMVQSGGCDLVLLQVWSWHCSLGPLQTSSASSAWWHSSVDTVSLQYKSHRQYLQCVWLQALVEFLENISLWEDVVVREVNISLWEGVAHNGPERKYFACYWKNISLREGVVVQKASFLLFHFGRVLRSCKQYFMLSLVCHGTLASDVICSSSVMYPCVSGYCRFSQCQLYQSLCQFAIHSSLKGNRLPHLSPVLTGPLLAWPCHGSWCTWPAMQLKTDEWQLNLLGLPFLSQGSSHEVSLLARAIYLPVAVLWSLSGLLKDSFLSWWPFPWASSWSGSAFQWSHYSVGSLVMRWCVWCQDL